MKITPELTALRTDMPHLFGLTPDTGLPALVAALDYERTRSALKVRALTQLMRSYQASVRWGKDRMPPDNFVPPQPVSAPVEAEPDWQEEYEAEQAALLNAYLEEQKNNPEPNPAERDYTPIPESPFGELEAQFNARATLEGVDDTD